MGPALGTEPERGGGPLAVSRVEPGGKGGPHRRGRLARNWFGGAETNSWRATRRDGWWGGGGKGSVAWREGRAKSAGPHGKKLGELRSRAAGFGSRAEPRAWARGRREPLAWRAPSPHLGAALRASQLTLRAAVPQGRAPSGRLRARARARAHNSRGARGPKRRVRQGREVESRSKPRESCPNPCSVLPPRARSLGPRSHELQPDYSMRHVRDSGAIPARVGKWPVARLDRGGIE